MSGVGGNNKNHVEDEDIIRISKIILKVAREQMAEEKVQAKPEPEEAAGFFDIGGRYKQSALYKFANSDGVDVESSDMAVNTFVLVSALLLAIPFGVQATLNREFWDDLRTSIGDCNPDYSTSKIDSVWLGFYNENLNLIYGSTYAAMIAVAIAVIYYILRPSCEQFNQWFKRGKWGVALISILTVITVVMCLTIVGNLASIYTNSTVHICNYLQGGTIRYAVSAMTGTLLLVLSFVLCGLLLFL